MHLKRMILFVLIAVLSLNVIHVSASDADTFVAFKFDEASLDDVQTKYGIIFENSYISVSNVNTGLYPYTGKMTVYGPTYNDDGSIKKTGESNFRIKWAQKQDVSEYSYVNMLIYSPEATGSKLAFGAYYDGNTSIQKYNTDGGIVIDFMGWKLLSLPMNNFGGMNWDKLTTLRFSTNVYHKPGDSEYAWLEPTYFNFDRIWFSKDQITLPVGQDFYPAKGERVSAFKPRIMISFNNNLSAVSDGMISLFKNGEAYSSSFDIITGNNIVDIVINSDLSPDTSYTLKLTGIKDEFGQVMANDLNYDFATYADDIGASEVTAVNSDGDRLNAIPSDGIMKLSADIRNFGINLASPVIFAIIYDETGKQTDVCVGEMAVPLSSGEQGAVSVIIPAQKLASAACVRAFVSKGTDDVSILGGRFADFSRSEASGIVLTEKEALSPILIETDEPSLDNGIMTLSGKINIPLASVLVKFCNQAGTASYMMPVISGEDGTFTLSFPLNSDSGMFEFTAQYGEDITEPKQFYYISDAECDSIKGRINDAQSAAEVEGILREYPYEFEIGKRSNDEISDLAIYIYEKADYNTYPEIKDRSKLYGTVLKNLKDSIWSNIDKVIMSDGDNIFSDKTDFLYYSGLDEAQRVRICEKLAPFMPVKTISGFRTAFHSAVEGYKEEIESSESDSDVNTGYVSTGGGGSFRVDTPATPNPTTPGNASSEHQGATPGSLSFDDMDAVPWAQEAVSALVKAGVISNSADKRYRPLDDVKREEFVKLLACVLNLKTDGMNAVFTDTENNAWYVPYIGAALNDGIVFGLDDGSFGIGSAISRQDMAVMLYRALNARGYITLNKEKTAFLDNDLISDYARLAVDGLSQSGFVKGNDSGEFNPLGYLTRAEAAQVIYRVYNVISGEVISVE